LRIRGAFKVAGSIIIVLLLLFLGCILVSKPKSPPVMQSIHEQVKKMDYSDLPPVSYFTARDGTRLAYRLYSGNSDKVAILLHGSSGSSTAMHALGNALKANNITAYALDVRGHGESGIRGDIRHEGQLQEDFADVVSIIRNNHPQAEITLVGHSSGGGFALKMVGGPLGTCFNQCILLAPYLNYDSPTVRPGSGGWANPSIVRMMGITVLNRFNIHCLDNLAVVSFAIPKEIAGLTQDYSYRLWKDYKASDDYLKDFKNEPIPVVIIVGDEDEIVYADKYAPEIKPVAENVKVDIIPSVNHMAVVSNERAIKTILRYF